MKLTAGQVRALEVIEAAGSIRPRAFAKAMWPESEGWRRQTRCGNNGVTRGGGMCLAGGGYLGKLVQLGVVEQQFRNEFHRQDGFALTDKGKTILADKRKIESKVKKG